jgi:redox-sensitive bicupin YhaK (pirin superfamily)
MNPIELQPHETTLPGGLVVRRLLPAAAARAVGPFVFFDHFGPVELPPALDSDVGGHPHIGLATVSYLFEGALLHRDSLGNEQLIEPGAVNWMHAGHGIVHSERTPPDARGQTRQLHGLQLWVALPPGQTDSEPSFQHVAADAIPQRVVGGATLRLLVGEFDGLQSPVRTVWPTLYLDVQLPPNSGLSLPRLAEQWAVYAPQAGLNVDSSQLPEHRMRVLGDEAVQLFSGSQGARAVFVGGAALPQTPRMWWNFVAYERETLGAAAARWAEGRFPSIPGEHDRIEAPPWRG